MALAGNNLTEYYKLNFTLMQDYKWSPEYLDGLMPFEKEIYLALLHEHLIKEEERLRKSIN